MKYLTVILPTAVIGGFEFVRHEFLLHLFSMEVGNWLITLMTLVISWLFSNWMFRTIERKNRQLAEEQAKSAVYEERERIAQELHDNIAQLLFFLNVTIKQGKMEEAKSAVSEIDHHLRQAIFNLRASPEEGVRFTKRVMKWLEEWSEVTGIAISQRLQVPEHYFTTSEEVQLFAIIQEAFTNIRKHSRAERVRMTLEASSAGWRLEIADDGDGFAERGRERNKYGLSMMQKRAAELNAVLSIDSDRERGTNITISGSGR